MIPNVSVLYWNLTELLGVHLDYIFQILRVDLHCTKFILESFSSINEMIPC